ncbi:PrpF domain-containing protein [Paludibacterium paludis]|uniref:4-oxalomesaconate tautomerase n=1 Tax=Paludibacterium paludis TaxID=1225769 RepID=A0A918P2A7_9NEIS|nr:PrpF domain-containing protein [Paludibacterium paludis]GGY14127.1 hypothetical protein GCM10011289_16860 [Paludibacterium paludis]
MWPCFPDPALAHLVPSLRRGVVEFPVFHVRGGTSTGLVLWARHMPDDPDLRDELLRHLMGVPLDGALPGNRQCHGLGRIAPTGNKVFIADREADGLVGTLAQLAADTSAIDWSVNCGNLSAALPLFALDSGLLVPPAGADRISVTIRNTNTESRLRAALRLDRDGGVPADTVIPGVDGGFSGVDLFLDAPVGAKTGRLLPTGVPRERIGDMWVTCMDVAVPMVIAEAAAFGKTGYETPAELDADGALRVRMREVRVAAGLRMGLRHPSGAAMSADDLARSETLPKLCLIAPAREGGHLSARYFTPQHAHASLAVSGGCCLAAACLVPGTVAHAMCALPADDGASREILLENPVGVLATRIDAQTSVDGVEISGAAYTRSAQILLRGLFPLYRASGPLRACLAGRR